MRTDGSSDKGGSGYSGEDQNLDVYRPQNLLADLVVESHSDSIKIYLQSGGKSSGHDRICLMKSSCVVFQHSG